MQMPSSCFFNYKRKLFLQIYEIIKFRCLPGFFYFTTNLSFSARGRLESFTFKKDSLLGLYIPIGGHNDG